MMKSIQILGFVVTAVAAFFHPLCGAADDTSLETKYLGAEMQKFGFAPYGGSGADHISMPGIILGFRYAGKGPLPAPVEVTIPLAKPLPLGGSYRVFVKNFHLGRMEATLGDVTKPLRMVRFDWTAGEVFEPNAIADKIVLRYFPSEIVAENGAAQDQLYIVQGLFITSSRTRLPIKGGEIVDLLPQEQPAARMGNYIANGSFETGMSGWGKQFGTTHVYGVNDLDPKEGAEGSTSLRLTVRPRLRVGIETPMMRMPPGRKYTLSFWAKADRPARLAAALSGMSDDLKTYGSGGIGTSIEPTTEWKQYVAAGKLEPCPGFLYTLGFEVPAPADGAAINLWIDGVQLREDAELKFMPRDAVEVGCWTTDAPGNIFYDDEPAASKAQVAVNRTTGARPLSIQEVITDLTGKVMETRDLKATPAEPRHVMTAPLFAARRGLFRATFSVEGGGSCEMVYSVLPRNASLGTLAPEGSLGTDAGFDPDHLRILKRANFNWVLSKFVARWNAGEPEEGKMVYQDQQLEEARKEGISVALQILNTSPQAWLAQHIQPAGGGAWAPEHRAFFMSAWERYVTNVAQHYKGKVTHYEIENEPGAADEYAQVLRLASAAIRKADPAAKVVAMSGGGFRPDFYQKVIDTVGVDAVDALSVHLYGNEAPVHGAFGAFCAKVTKPGWNTETGATCQSSFMQLPSFEEFRRSGYRQEVLNTAHAQAIRDVNNYLTSRSYGRMSRYFYYFARFGNCSPSQPTRFAGNGKELVEYDGSLRANAVGLSIASHTLDGATYVKRIPIAGDAAEAHLFSKAGRTVGFLWAASGRKFTVRAPAGSGIILSEFFGNVVADANAALDDAPVYFQTDGAPEAAEQALQTVKVEPAAGPK